MTDAGDIHLVDIDQELRRRGHHHRVAKEPWRSELLVLVEHCVIGRGRFREPVSVSERHGVEVERVAKPGGRFGRKVNRAACEPEGLGVPARAQRPSPAARSAPRLRCRSPRRYPTS